MENFVKEKISVNIIPTLDNDDFKNLGIIIIGEKKVLLQAVKHYIG